MQFIVNILIFLLMLDIIVIVHEFGHYITAKHFGVYCEAFSIGMGPKIYGKKGKETEFQIRAFPIGGFVSMAGEADQEDNENLKDVPIERSLKGKKTYQKIIIFLAGVFNNFLLALIVMIGINMTVGTEAKHLVTIDSVVENSPAETAGLKKGDVILSAKNTENNQLYDLTYDDFSKIMTKEYLGTDKDTVQFLLTVERDNKDIELTIDSTYNEETKVYYFGYVQQTQPLGFMDSITTSLISIGSMSLLILDALKQLVLNFTDTIHQMSGPVGIYQVTASVASQGSISRLLSLMCMLSVNIGVFNLMPIPGLDGAQALIAIAEGIVGHELPVKLKYGLQFAGLALLLLLMVVITVNDIMNLL